MNPESIRRGGQNKNLTTYRHKAEANTALFHPLLWQAGHACREADGMVPFIRRDSLTISADARP